MNSCGLCFNAFPLKGTAKRHYQDVHMAKANQGNPFLCKVPGCNKNFGTENYMKKHMHRSHGISDKMIPSTSKAKTTKKSVKKPKEPSKKLIAVEPQNIDVKEGSADMMEESTDVKEEPIED